MEREVYIHEILDFLEDNEIDFNFVGKKDEKIEGFSTLFNYKKSKMTFISTLYKFKDYSKEFNEKTIKLILTDPSEEIYSCFENTIQIKKPTNAFFSIIEHFFNSDKIDDSTLSSHEQKYREQSYISDKAIIGKSVKIGQGCIIEAGVQIGENTEVHHNVVLRTGTKIGRNCRISSGTIIGERGFNPYTLDDGSKQMISHFGGVDIGDNVEVGVNCSVHKGAIDDTVIASGVKINAMVHIAHNCFIGEHTVITMPTQVCGSVRIGRNCHIAATTIRNQCTIGDNAVLGLGSVVINDVDDETTVVGVPAKPLKK